MLHFLLKRSITLMGAGMSGPSTPPPPVVTQYPGVLAPPQLGDLNTISSFSYAQMVDLISDGPIEGIVNKDGKKVYDENLFEGIYLNDTPVKETSLVKKESIDITFLKTALKNFWSKNSKLTLSSGSTVTGVTKVLLSPAEIDNQDFDPNISITSYHPSESIYAFLRQKNANFDSQSLIQRAFDLSPIPEEQPFLTIIKIPSFKIYLSKDRFDTSEGQNGNSPLKIGMTNISDYIYFSIGYNNLTSFNYFEMPRSYIENSVSTISNKKSFDKTLIDSTDYYVYQVNNLVIYIWSLYHQNDGIKNIDNILDRYFNSIYVFQNDASLFNYNLIQSEFKNGSEIQPPLSNFNNIEIDVEYQKELVGPFKLSNSFAPKTAFDAGGVQRLTQFSATPAGYAVTNISLENETSDDIRYIKNWPVEYNKAGDPYLIKDALTNYSQFDKTSSSRVDQDCIPITHYIANENIEEVYVTVSLNSLYDTNHTDLVCTNAGIDSTKASTSDDPPPYTKKYGELPGTTNIVTNTVCTGYLLVYSPTNDVKNGYVLDGSSDDKSLLNNINAIKSKTCLYYKAISQNGFASIYVGDTTKLFENGYNIQSFPILCQYMVPNNICLLNPSFKISNYDTSEKLQSKLSLLNDDGSPAYCFGVTCTQSICLIDYKSASSLGGFYYKLPYSYYAVSDSNTSTKAIVGTLINDYIDWASIFCLPNYGDDYKYNFKDSTGVIRLTSIAIPQRLSSLTIDSKTYPNIKKYLIDPLLLTNPLQATSISTGLTENVFSFKKLTQEYFLNLFLVGFNNSYLVSKAELWQVYDTSRKFLKLSVLDNLLELYVLKTRNGILSLLPTMTVKDTNISVSSVFQDILQKFDNGKLLGSSSVYSIKSSSISSSNYISSNYDITAKNFNVFTSAEKNSYLTSNIYLYDKTKFTIDAQDAQKDIVFFYELFSNVRASSALPLLKQGTMDPALANATQSLTAGTKLPAIVSLKVETGYESKEQENYIAPGEYFQYRYDIFGLSTDQSLIDLGRKSYSFVKGTKLSSDRGGYLSTTQNKYYYCNNFYLYKFYFQTAANFVNCIYFVSDSDEFLDLSKHITIYTDENNLQPNESWVVENSYNIGICRDLSALSITDANTCIQNIGNVLYNKLNSLVQCNKVICNNNILTDPAKKYITTINDSNKDLYSQFFNSDGCILNLVYFQCFGNKFNFFNIKNWLIPVEAYANSFGCLSHSLTCKDVYCFNYNSSLNTKIEKYNFKYTNYQTLTNSSQVIAETFTPKTYNVYFIYGYNYYDDGDTFIDTQFSSPLDTFHNFVEKNTVDGFYIPVEVTHKGGVRGPKVIIGSLIFSTNDVYQYIQDDFQFHINIFTYGSTFGPINGSITINNIENVVSELSKKLNKYSQLSSNDLNTIINTIYNKGKEFYNYGDYGGRLFEDYYGFLTFAPITTVDSRSIVQTNTLNQINIPLAKFWLLYNNNTKDVRVIYKMPSIENNVVNYNDLGDSSLEQFDLACFVIGGSPAKYNINKNIGLQASDNWINLDTNQGHETKGDGTWYLDTNVSISALRITPSDQQYYDGFYKGYSIVGTCFNHGATYKWKINSITVSNDLCIDGSYTGLQFGTFKSSSFTNQNILLKDLEAYLQTVKIGTSNFTVLPSDVHILDYNIPFKVGFGKNLSYAFSSVWSVKYFELSLSNINQNISNVFSNDAGTVIQLPPPKVDQDGKQIRRYVKVSKMSHETLSPFIGKKVALQKVTEIIPQKFSYPFSSIVGTKIDARSFSQIPNRTFDCKLKKILVPSNYFPLDSEERDIRYLYGFNYGTKYKIYDGDWDGTFKLAWTNNPAWILMDLLVNKRYGLGNYIESEQVDIWELYKIARWCDGVDDNGYYFGVPDSYGGVEPRHAFNALIKDKFNVYDMINQIASVFRGHVYYMNSLITFDDDRLKPAIGEFSNADVKDGLFSYTNHKKDDEYTAVDVAYIDARDNYKAKIEYVEDSDGIRKRGILKKQINAFGITSRGQARRFGKHFLFQTSKENSNVSFTTDMKALLYKPGDLININDELQSSIKNYGVVKDVAPINDSCFKIVIDKILDSGIYNDQEITLYTPTAKPKYDDISSSIACVPSIVNLSTIPYSFFVGNFGGEKVCLYKTNNFDPKTNTYNYTGLVKYIPFLTAQTACSKLYLNYINNFDINQNSSRYGHWELLTGSVNSTSGNKDYIIKLDATQSGLSNKLNGEYQEYFFNLFDTIYSLCKTGTYVDGSFLYQKTDLSDFLKPTTYTLGNVSIYRDAQYSVCASGFASNNILFQDIVQNDYPSIESFFITGYTTGSTICNLETINEYTEICLSRSGLNCDGDFYRKKSVDDYLVQNILVGSPYSLKIQNRENCLYKIMSITENYINEYNILATQYNRQKFKEIEENDACDNLLNTFNFITAYTEKSNSTTATLLKSPIFNAVEYVKDYNNIKYLVFKWTASQNATAYNVYIKTPSSQTRNYSIVVYPTDTNYYNASNGTFQYPWLLPNEIGTYTVTIEAFAPAVGGGMYKFSPEVSRSISILEY